MRVLINFATLKGGGGQTVALNFVTAASEFAWREPVCYYLVARNSEVHKFLRRTKSTRYLVAPRNPILRVAFEMLIGPCLLYWLRIDIVYSYFGHALFPRYWPQVTGSADSNLYFPEIDFWAEYRGLQRFRKYVVDTYRRFGVKRADGVVFENAAMEARGRELLRLRSTKLIKPSIHFPRAETCDRILLSGSGPKRALCLSGWQLHKNIMRIPELAAEIKRRGRALTFIITAPQDHSNEHRRFCDLVDAHNVNDMIVFTGSVAKGDLPKLYEQVHLVLLLSKLESFSNTIIEAWYFQRPLVISDALWARGICGEAALFVDRESIVEVADGVCRLLDSPGTVEEIVSSGRRMLENYPTIDERIRQEMSYVREVLENS